MLKAPLPLSLTPPGANPPEAAREGLGESSFTEFRLSAFFGLPGESTGFQQGLESTLDPEILQDSSKVYSILQGLARFNRLGFG